MSLEATDLFKRALTHYGTRSNGHARAGVDVSGSAIQNQGSDGGMASRGRKETALHAAPKAGGARLARKG